MFGSCVPAAVGGKIAERMKFFATELWWLSDINSTKKAMSTIANKNNKIVVLLKAGSMNRK